MSTKQEIFKEFLGGNVFNGELDEFERYMMDIVEESYNHMIQNSPSSYPEVHIGIVNDTSFNAFAFKYKNSYFITFHIGLIRTLRNFYCYLFSRNDVFSEIDASKEQNPEIDINFSDIDNYIDNIGDIFSNHVFSSIRPKSVERENAAKTFAGNALSLLFFHEYGHVVHGHLDYSISKNMSLSFHEAFSHNTGNLVGQCLEMDADSFAAAKTISLVQDPAFWSGSALTMGFSSIFIFQLLSTKIDNLEFLADYSHPIPSIRQMIYLTTMHAFFYQFGENVANEIVGEITDIILAEYKVVFMDILGLEKEDLSLALTVNITVDDHFKKIMNTWNEIHDDLLKYSYGPIADKDYW